MADVPSRISKLILAKRIASVRIRNATVDVDYEGSRSRGAVAELAIDLDHSRRRSVISALARIESDRAGGTPLGVKDGLISEIRTGMFTYRRGAFPST